MRKFLVPWLAILVTALLTLPSARAAAATDPTYSFDLTGPQAATNGTQTIVLSGAGSFDPTAETVVASGAFKIIDNSGAVVSEGIWKATAFNSFCPRGGPNSGTQGGVLVITVTLFPRGKPAMAGLTMTVTCLVFHPPFNVGTCSPVGEGVIVGDFSTIVAGRTLFHLNE